MFHINKILIIRLSSFGDIILTYPLLTKLRKMFPVSEIHFFTKEKYSSLLRMNRNVNLIIPYKNESVTEIRKNIRENKYDVIIDIHKNIRSFLFTSFNGIKKLKYNKGNLKKLILVILKKNFIKNIIPVYKKYMIEISELQPESNFDFTTTDLMFDKKKIVEGNYILISPSSKHFTKILPKEKFTDIINSLKGTKIVLTGENVKRDIEICNYLETISDSVLNLCGKTDFEQLTNLIYHSECVICNDSGIMHLAEALGKKVYAFFGSTVKEFGFYPQLKTSEIFENNNLDCRPCTHIGKEKCPKGHFKCMQDIDVKNIISKLFQ